jgi:enoyl-CoA hydratase/carnithine racemase
VLVLTGAGGRAFSAGMHVDTFVSAGPDGGRDVIERVGACVGAVRTTPVPTICVVDGYCLGAAFEMALACDLRVATPQSSFGLPEVLLGIPSVVEASLLLPHVGLSLATEMILTGARYPAGAMPAGFVNRLVAREALAGAVTELVAALTQSTREVLAAQKSLFGTWLDTGLTEGIETSKQVFGDVFALPVTQTAISDYAARRSGAASRRPRA